LISPEATAHSNASDYALLHSINHLPVVICFLTLLAVRSIKSWRQVCNLKKSRGDWIRRRLFWT